MAAVFEMSVLSGPHTSLGREVVAMTNRSPRPFFFSFTPVNPWKLRLSPVQSGFHLHDFIVSL